MKPHDYRSIVVVGGGTAGWMTANLLACEPGWEDVRITIVESSEIGTIGVGEGSLPTIRQFFKRIGVTEKEWMPRCDATFKCGIGFVNWSEEKGFEQYFHPFFSMLDQKPADSFFKNCDLRRGGVNAHAHPESYFVTEELVRQYKSPIPHNPLPFEHDYAYHFSAGLLADYLKELAVTRGVNHVVDTVSAVKQSDDGSIDRLIMEESGELHADFFIDCTGFTGLLINKTLKVPFLSFKDNMFNDRAVAIATPLGGRHVPSQTGSYAMNSGWAWRIPLTSRFGNGYVYSSDFITDDDAEKELREHLGKDADGVEARRLKMRVGRVTEPWRKNCLAVGLSQGFIEPLEATALGIVQYSVEQFLKTCRKAVESDVGKQRDNYNAGASRVYERIRDYIVLHYILNKRSDTDYWVANRNNRQISDVLAEILVAWDSGAEIESVIKRNRSVYKVPSWYCILAGMGRFPAVCGEPALKAQARADNARAFCKEVSDGFHTHESILDSIHDA